MPILNWKERRNLENSFVDHITDYITTNNITVLDENGDSKNILTVAGSKVDINWSLPVIQIYMDGKVAPRLSIGSSKRQKSFLVIIDIRALDKGMQLDLTELVEDIINNGFIFYNIQPNPGDPDNPTKTQEGYVSVDFVSNIPLRLGDNADLFDKYRQNISLSCVIE